MPGELGRAGGATDSAAAHVSAVPPCLVAVVTTIDGDIGGELVAYGWLQRTSLVVALQRKALGGLLLKEGGRGGWGAGRLEETEIPVHARIADVKYLALATHALRPNTLLLGHIALHDPSCIFVHQAKIRAPLQVPHDGAVQQPVREKRRQRSGAAKREHNMRLLVNSGTSQLMNCS